MLNKVKQRLQREWSEYASDPEVRLGRLYRGMKQSDRKQVFRSLVQVNVYPRAKGTGGQ
jgi:hypothetical protein